jgi:transposase
VNDACPVSSVTLGDHRLAAKGVMLTTRAAKWVVKEIVSGQSVSHLAKELRCSWDSVNRAMRVYGAALLAADTKRLKETTAIGLDETLFVRRGPYKKKSWSTTVCDVVNHQLIDVVPTREFTEVAGWLRAQPHHVKDNLNYGCLDMSRTYSAVFKVVTPKATLVIDRFHVMRHALLSVDEVRRRVQQQRLGHRGRSDDPLYKAASSSCSRPRRVTPIWRHVSRDSWPWVTPTARWPSPTASKRPSRASTRTTTPRGPSRSPMETPMIRSIRARIVRALRSIRADI